MIPHFPVTSLIPDDPSSPMQKTGGLAESAAQIEKAKWMQQIQKMKHQ